MVRLIFFRRTRAKKKARGKTKRLSIRASFARFSAFNSRSGGVVDQKRGPSVASTKEEVSSSAARHRGHAPKRGQEARSAAEAAAACEIPVSSLLLVSPKQDRKTSQMSRLREYSPTWAHAACPEERREPETSFSRGAFLLAFSFFFSWSG